MIDTEEKARKKVSETWAAKELFVILSESQYRDEKSVPRMFRVSDSDIALSIFTSLGGTEDAMHIKLVAMFEWGGRQFGNISMLMSKAEFERVQAGGKLELHFNPMPLFER